MDSFIQKCITNKEKIIFNLVGGKDVRGRIIDYTSSEFLVEMRGFRTGWIIINRNNYLSFSKDNNSFITKKGG